MSGSSTTPTSPAPICNDMTVYGPVFVGRRARRLRRLPCALARRREQGRGRSDGLDEDLPGGPPPRTDQGRRPGGADRRHRRRAHPQRPVPLPGASATSLPRSPASRRVRSAWRAWSHATASRRSHAARDEIFAQTERLERAAVAAIPDGRYSAEGSTRRRRRRRRAGAVRARRGGDRRGPDDPRPLRHRRYDRGAGELRCGAGSVRGTRSRTSCSSTRTAPSTAVPSAPSR